jgi:hypothetical protein
VTLKKLWHDPVWSKVIGGLITAALLAIAGWVVHRENWWPVVWRGVVTAWSFIFSTTPIRHWVLGLLIIAVLLLVVILIFLAVILLRARKQNSPDWQSYTSDSFYDLKWVWAYEGREVLLKAVLCSHCGYQVGPDSTSRFDSRVRFHCDSCGRTVPVEGQSWDSLQSVVVRLVQKKLRDSTYPKRGEA